mgnify:CR=1 FL=1
MLLCCFSLKAGEKQFFLYDDSSQISLQTLSPSVNYTRLGLIGGAYAVTITSIHIYQSNAWWKNFRKPFHFREDLVYGASVDKVGHLVAANFASFFINHSLQWADVDEMSSLYYGAIGGSLFELYIEFEDGFSQWGFDRVDATMDVIGAWYPVMQYHFPLLKNFRFKASYYPRKLNEPGGIQGQKHIAVDDYEGQTFWLSVKTKHFFSEETNKVFPPFLNLAVGLSVRGTGPGEKQQPVVLIGLDYDWEEIIPQDTWTGKTWGEWLNFVRFPAPAIQISPDVVCYGLYF